VVEIVDPKLKLEAEPLLFLYDKLLKSSMFSDVLLLISDPASKRASFSGS